MRKQKTTTADNIEGVVLLMKNTTQTSTMINLVKVGTRLMAKRGAGPSWVHATEYLTEMKGSIIDNIPLEEMQAKLCHILNVGYQTGYGAEIQNYFDDIGIDNLV